MPVLSAVVLAVAMLSAVQARGDVPPPSAMPAGQAGRPLSLKAAVAQAVAGNPGLNAIRARAAALDKIPAQVGTLPDPDLILNAMNLPVNTFALRQEAMTQLQVGLSQKLPYPGKLALQASAAQFEAQSAAQEATEMRLRLVRDVRTVWWNLFYLDRALEILADNLALLRQLVRIAQTKYTVGAGLQQDVLLAQVELSKLLDREIQLRGMRRAVEAQLDALLDYPAVRAVRLPQRVDEELPDIAREEVLRVRADTLRPLLVAQKNREAAARARLDLARKEYFPDFKVGVAYGFRNGRNPNDSDRADFLSVMFTMNLPIHTARRQDNQVNQRASELLEQHYRRQDLRGQVGAEIARALADYRRAREQAALFRQGIIPQASQTVASMRAGYQVNKVDFLNLVRAQITLFNYETQYWKTLSEARQALAGLSAAVGKEDVYE